MMQPHKAFPSESDRAVLIVLASGKQMQINCSAKQYLDGLKAYVEGAMIQDAFPFLDAGEREFLMSGITPDEWDRMFGDE